MATGLIFWSTQLVNAVCHLPNVGYRSHETREQSSNVWFVGLLALGEGWHNNHHAVPKSARHGFAWFEVDVTWYAVWLLEKLGLARAVIRPPKSFRACSNENDGGFNPESVAAAAEVLVNPEQQLSKA